MRIRRRFVQVGERRVHYLRAGTGPPVVLIHSSPANAWLLSAEILRLSQTYTVFAPDTPGFGLSDPLPLAQMQVADLADALAKTLEAMEMPVCPIFGSHTGAAIALEFGVRHKHMVSGLVLDGVPAFTTQECEVFFVDYFRELRATDLGGQYAEIWTRFRDQSIWFPWSERRPENLNPYDLGAPESTHLWASMYFEAEDTYRPAYRAASFYGERALAAAAALTVPAIFTATDTDMLFPHLKRLPPLRPGQEIRHIGASHAAKRELIAEGFARFGGATGAPDDKDAVGAANGVARQFFDGAQSAQAHVRFGGDPAAPALLFLHDAPGSSAQWEPLIAALSKTWFVIAPDLPGAGESDPLSASAPSVTDFAAASLAVLDHFKVAAAAVYAVGFGSSVALELAQSAPDRIKGLILRGLLAPDAQERAAMTAALAPPIEIERDGGHWYRTWLMLRDSLVWWPWYERRKESLRRVPADFGAKRLHKWTLDVMRRRQTYGDMIHAALRHDAPEALARLTHPVMRLIDPLTPLSVYDQSPLIVRDCLTLDVEADPAHHAAALASACEGRL